MPKVTLTFDNGPEPEVTPLVLDCLAKRDLKATFFVMGRKVITPEARSIAQRASAEGHWIGNHTYSHSKPLGELDRVSALTEFEQAENSLAWLEQPQRLFRPYGRSGALGRHLLHTAVVERLIARHYTCVLWNCVPGDWKDPHGWLPRAITECTTREWSLVVLHDLPSGAMSHLGSFLDALAERGIPVTQDFPPDCIPIRSGQTMLSMEPYVSDPR